MNVENIHSLCLDDYFHKMSSYLHLALVNTNNTYSTDLSHIDKQSLREFLLIGLALRNNKLAPTLVEACLFIAEALCSDVSSLSQASLLSMGILRYIDTLVYIQREQNRDMRSMVDICADSNLAKFVVECRHKIVHRNVPCNVELTLAAQHILHHALNTYFLAENFSTVNAKEMINRITNHDTLNISLTSLLADSRSSIYNSLELTSIEQKIKLLANTSFNSFELIIVLSHSNLGNIIAAKPPGGSSPLNIVMRSLLITKINNSEQSLSLKTLYYKVIKLLIDEVLTNKLNVLLSIVKQCLLLCLVVKCQKKNIHYQSVISNILMSNELFAEMEALKNIYVENFSNNNFSQSVMKDYAISLISCNFLADEVLSDCSIINVLSWFILPMSFRSDKENMIDRSIIQRRYTLLRSLLSTLSIIYQSEILNSSEKSCLCVTIKRALTILS